MKLVKSKLFVFFVIFSMLINMLMLNNVSAYNTKCFDTGEISGYVWFDFNGNGKWEYNNWHENVISGVKIDLCDENNQVLNSTTTTGYGQYFFKGLPWGSYKVKVHLPSGYAFTNQGSGNGNGVKYRLSKVDANTGITDIIYPTSRDVNVGLIQGESTENPEDPPAPPVQGSLMDINRTVSKPSATVGESFDVKYTINPKPVLTQQDNTQKDIVLVIDTSGSMYDYPSANSRTSKLETIKAVANNFVDSFENKENVNISLAKFDNQAKILVPLTNMKSHYIQSIYDGINGLKANGSTNIGDGLRVAYNQLNNNNGHDKYIVFMTDGRAEAYSYNNGYVMGTEDVNSYDIYATKWDGYHKYANPDYRAKSLVYAKKVASEKIANSNIKSFFVGFGTEANSNNTEIAEAAKGTYQSAIDKTTVAKVYDQIQKQIDSTIQGNAAFQETFSNNLEVDTSTLPSGLKVDGNKITGNINIEYTLNSLKTQYEQNKPIEFTVKYKVKSKSNCIWGQDGNSSLVKLDVSSKTEMKYFPQKEISVIDGGSNTDELMNISRTVDIQNVKVGDAFEANYTIKPNSILAQQDNTQKDIVLVMDTSISMNDAPNSYSETSKLEIIQSVASNFVSKFNNKNNVNIALVEYNSLAKIDKELTNMGDYTAVDSLVNAINSLKMNWNTNTGDGLRKAYYMLQKSSGENKYIILMTDGATNTYSIDQNWNYYMNSGEAVNYNSYGDGDPYGYGLTYAKKVASEQIANSNIKSFIVGFGSEANSNNTEIAKAAKGIYQPAGDEAAVNNVYDTIQKEIDSSIHGNAAFQETFSSNLEVDTSTLPQGLKVDGNKITGNIDVQYTLNRDKTQYECNPIKFKVKYKVKSKESCVLGQGGNSSSVKLTVSDKPETKYFSEIVIPVVDISVVSSPEVSINITDGTGNVDNYFVNSNNTVKRVDKFLPGQTKLRGDCYANISFKSESADIFQYKIVPYSTDPKDINIDSLTDWKTLDLKQQKVNNDVVLDEKGYLNQRSYDVSHLPNLKDEISWNNPNLVFKTPFSATEYKSATYSANKDSYGKWEECIKDDSSKGKRWATNSIFLPNMFISDDYKEASKFWGYIKVPTDGNYYFGAISDDGCRGYITVDGETKAFVDMFKIQGATPGTKGNVFNLKADTYYPIYLEYSNWGGSAALELRYSNSPINSNSEVYSAARIPSEWFYPSKTLSPGEYTGTIFTGSVGIKFPKEPGNYYIAYRTGKKDDTGNIQRVDREGFYGGFTVEKKADLELKREVVSKKFNVGDEIEIKCTITPKPISVNSVYPDGNGPETYTNTVSNFRYQDIFPKGIAPISKNDSNTVINGQKINIKLPDNITYIKDGTEYKADAIPFSVYVKIDANGSYILKGTDSVITYTDIDSAKSQLNFNDLNINGEGTSNILKQGIYEKNNTKYKYIRSKEDISKEDINEDLRVVQKMPTELAMVVDIKTSKPKIKLNISGKYVQGAITFKKYELNVDGTMNTAVQPQTISLDSSNIEINSSDTFKLDKDKKYLINYSITSNGVKDEKITVDAYIDNKSEPDKMILVIDNLPKVQ